MFTMYSPAICSYVGELLGNGGGASEEARCAALAEAFAEARSMRRAMLVLEDIDLLLAAPGAAAGGGGGVNGAGGGLSRVLLGALRSLVREPLDAPPPSTTTAADAPLSPSAAAGGAPASSAPCLLVVATASAPSAGLLEALRPTFRSLVRVPLLHTVDEAAAALRASPALERLLAPSACEAAAAFALADGPIAVSTLHELVEAACLEATALEAADLEGQAVEPVAARAGGTGATAAQQLKLIEERCLAYR